MSVYSSLVISREAALKAYINYKIGNISDQELERVVDEILEPSLYNCVIDGFNRNDNDDDLLAQILGH
jgi:hypothetical protein